MAERVKERHEGTAPGFSGGDEETWQTSVGTGSSRVLGTTQTSHGDVAGWGNRFRRLARAGSGWDARQWINLTAFSTGGAYWHFETILVSESMGNAETISAARLVNTAAGDDVLRVAVHQSAGGSLFWRLLSFQAGDGGGATSDIGPSITTGQVYRHDLLYDFDDSRVLWYVDGVEIVNATGITTVSQINQLLLGAGSGETQSATTIDYDRILLDDAAWPEYDTPHRALDLSLTIGGAEVGDLVVRESGSLDLEIGSDPDALSFSLRDHENRLADSENLDDTGDWTRQNLVGVTGPDDGPNGSDELAFTIGEDSSLASNHRLQQASVPVIGDKVMTATCWVADQEHVGAQGTQSRNYEIIIFHSGGTFFAKFDLDTGTINAQSVSGSGVDVDATIEQGPAFGGTGPGGAGFWYRVTVTGRFDDPLVTSITWIHSVLDDGFARVYDGDGQSGVRVWNPQLTHGTKHTARFEITTGDTPYQDGPGDLDEAILTLGWYEADGAFWGEAVEFGGHVIDVSRQEVAASELGRIQGYQFQAASNAREYGRRRFDETVADGALSDALDKVVALVSDDGYTANLQGDTDPTIAGDSFGYAPATTMTDEIMRRGGRLYRVEPDREVRGFVAGSQQILTLLDRDDGPNLDEIPRAERPTWKTDSRKLATEVRVVGDDILVTATDAGSTYPTHHAPVFNADGMASVTDAQRVADSLLNGLKAPIQTGSITTWKHGITPGMSAIVTDREWDVVEEKVNIRRVSMRQQNGGLWASSLELTTEELLSALGVMSPAPDNPRPGDPLPETEVFVVNGPIPSPNGAAPSPADGEVMLHFRFDSSTSTWRCGLHSGTNVGGTGAKWSANLFFEDDAAITVTHGEESTEAGEVAVRFDNSTRRVRVATGNSSGEHDLWELEINSSDVLTAIPSSLGGTLRAGVFISGSWVSELSSITVGGFTVATNVSTGRILRLVLPTDPSTQVEAGSIGTNELEDGAVTDAKVTAGRVLGNSSYFDGSNRPNRLRHSGGDLTADAAEDARARAQTGLTASGNVKAATKIGGDAADAASDVEDGASRARTAIDTSNRVRSDIHDGASLILDISANDLLNLQLLDSVDIGGTSPENANDIRAGSVRGLNALDTSYRLTGDVGEGDSGLFDGSSTFGIDVRGDGFSPLSDAGIGGGGGAGPGGDPTR